MKKLILQLLSTAMMLGMCLTAFAQHSYLTADGVAVFIPKDFDAAQHLPSPIFLRELVPTDTVPATWQLRPQFSIEKSRSVAIIQVGDALFMPEGKLDLQMARKEWPKDNFPFALESVPFEVKAKGRLVPSWTMDEYELCGVLPDEDAQKSDVLEDITLVPMGAARLRISAFPVTNQ